jgi:hypothetical protein
VPFPASLNTVEVSFTFLDKNGDPEEGTVSFARTTYLRSTSDDVIITPGVLLVTLTAGAGTIELPVTDDAQWTPQGWTYRVTEALTGGGREYDIQLPEAGGDVNLADIAPSIDPQSGVEYVLLTTVGEIGGPAGPLDGDGFVPASQLPPVAGGIPASDFDAKGDILVGTGDGTYDNLPVGTNGQVLKANSAEATGVEWADETGGGGAVDSVNGQTGVVVLNAGHVGAQPADGDLTAIAALTATTDNVIQSVGSAWASRTPAQLKATLALVKGDVGLGNVDNTSDANKPVSTATQTALDLKIDESLAAAKGDIFTATANDTPAILTVGTNNQFLRADSGEATGLRWDTLDASDLPTHTHDTADITAGTLGVQRGGTGLSSVTAGSFLQGAGTSALVVRSPAQVLSDIGAAAAAHTHTIRKTIPFDIPGNLAVVTGQARLYNREGVTLTIVGVWLYIITAPASQAVILDVHKVGTTIYTTQANRPQIAAGANVGALAAPAVTTWADGDYLTIDVDQIGTGTVGADLNGGIVVTYAG